MPYNRRYGRNNTQTPRQTGAPDVSSIKMGTPIIIEVDHREPAEFDAALEHELIEVRRCSLDIGDFRVLDMEANELIVERKRCVSDTGSDFEASVIDDGRLFTQTERLKLHVANADIQVIPFMILEGDLYGSSKRMLCQQIDGAISFVSAIQQINVLTTLDLRHTAYVIAKLAAHFYEGLYTPVTLHKAKPKLVFEQQRYILEALPGVSRGLAEKLLKQFGSVRGVFNASEDELLAVPGLGKKKVAGLVSLFSGT
jgi:ERCC4-type nuclease